MVKAVSPVQDGPIVNDAAVKVLLNAEEEFGGVLYEADPPSLRHYF